MQVSIETNTNDYIWTAHGRVPLPHEAKAFQIPNEWETRAQQAQQVKETTAAHFVQGVNILVGGVANTPESTD